MDLTEKVRELSKYLDDEAIAQALKLTPEAVRDILEGRAEIAQVERSDYSGPVIHVSSVKTAYRQKVISVCRAKGGVGCTVIALGLAYSLSKEIKTLLVDLNLSEGGSDLSYYLNLPEYPHLGALTDNLESCVISVEPNFYVLQAPKRASAEEQEVGQIITLARQDFDAIVIDLPNSQGEIVKEAVQQSNTIVAVTSGMASELLRLAAILGTCFRKDVIVAANRCDLPAEAREAFAGKKIIRIEHDGSLARVFEKCDLPGEKSVFMKGIGRIKDAVFDREKKGVLKTIFG